MRIGIDIDGVLADFGGSYARLIVARTGRNLFHAGDTVNPPVWDWEKYRGYTEDEIKAVWDEITGSPEFWVGLSALPGAETLARRITQLENNHDLYFVTARKGLDVKWQTEVWLNTMIPVQLPTVLLSKDKGAICRALSLDFYVDDNYDNIVGVDQQSPETRAYLLNYRYNAYPTPGKVQRVNSLDEMFRAEGL